MGAVKAEGVGAWVPSAASLRVDLEVISQKGSASGMVPVTGGSGFVTQASSAPPDCSRPLALWLSMGG